MNDVRGWHFAPDTMILAHGDGRPIVDGEALTVDGEIVPCANGLHASERVLDALQYADQAGTPAVCACRVRLSGTVVASDYGDKHAASERTCEWHLSADDTERVLWTFARQCAADALPLWDVPAVVREYIRTGDESRRAAARAAARVAAEAAARVAAGAAAEAAARVAAGAAAWVAAGAAAGAAARVAAGAAARAAARVAAEAAAGAAAGAAAWVAAEVDAEAAAWAAARDAQNTRLESWLAAAHEGRWDEIVVTIPEEASA